MTNDTATEYFVVDAPGTYGDRSRVWAAMSDRKSRAEQLLAEMDCHVNVEQRADALKAIEAYMIDAYEAGWHDEPNARTPEELRANAEAYTSDPEQP